MVAWCSMGYNQIRIAEFETNQAYTQFDGVQLKNKGNNMKIFRIGINRNKYIYQDDVSWTHVREIPGTRLLVSLNHNPINCANMEIADISNKDQVKKIF